MSVALVTWDEVLRGAAAGRKEPGAASPQCGLECPDCWMELTVWYWGENCESCRFQSANHHVDSDGWHSSAWYPGPCSLLVESEAGSRIFVFRLFRTVRRFHLT
jgi:hypothetical protein